MRARALEKARAARASATMTMGSTAAVSGSLSSETKPSPRPKRPPATTAKPAMVSRIPTAARPTPAPASTSTNGSATRGAPAQVKDADTAPVEVRSFDFRAPKMPASRPTPTPNPAFRSGAAARGEMGGASSKLTVPGTGQQPPRQPDTLAKDPPTSIAGPNGTKHREAPAGVPVAVASAPTPIDPIAQVSVPPVAPATVPPQTAKPTEASPFGGELDWDLDGDLDAAFEGAKADDEEPAGEGMLAPDESTREELEALFAKIASFHVGQVRDFIIELQTNDETSKQWIEICRSAVSSLGKAADNLRFESLAGPLRSFSGVLDRAGAVEGTRIRGALREEILAHYRELAAAMPDAFRVDGERDRREPIIIHALLSQIPGVNVLERDRLYAAGVNRLSAFYDAKADDIAATTGMDLELAQAIKQRFGDYRAERVASAPDEDRSVERKRLASLISDLRTTERQYREVERSEDGVRRRQLRKQKAHLMHEVELVLAQMGEVDLVSELSRLPVKRKIATIQAYLAKPGSSGQAGLSGQAGRSSGGAMRSSEEIRDDSTQSR